MIAEDNSLVRCVENPERGSLSFREPILGDRNRDGFQDVSVILGWWGGGSASTSYRTEFTRLGNSGPLIPISNLALPFDCETTNDQLEDLVCSSSHLRLLWGRLARIEELLSPISPESDNELNSLPQLRSASTKSCPMIPPGSPIEKQQAELCLLTVFEQAFEDRRQNLIDARCVLFGVDCQKPDVNTDVKAS